MKKIMYALAAAVLLLTGCGSKGNFMIIDNDDNITEHPRHTEEAEISTKPKRQEIQTTNVSSADDTNSEIQTAESVISTSSQNTFDSAPMESDISVISENNNNNNNNNTAKTSADTKVSNTSTETTTEAYYLDGIVYEVHDKYIIINESDFKKMQISVSDKSIIADIQVGDIVEIAYDGLIKDNNIKCAYDAYSIEVTKKANKKYQLENFEYNGVGFSMLVPEDWSGKTIEYPQEGNFTDWGIRFTPEGAVGSMDITWHSSITISGSFDKMTVTMNDISAKKYSRQGVWRFFVFENNYVATNNFFETSQHSDYADDMDLMLSTLEFI
ncbi:MAG: hypothetical protein K2I82_06055 [Ruminococcus sp.]|nr:hypothetical protein [Ruminococcus sp.]